MSIQIYKIDGTAKELYPLVGPAGYESCCIEI